MAEDKGQPKQVNQSLLTVLIAFLANLLIAIAKSVAAVITSSASMLAEAAHSWADAGNESLLLIADRRSDRRRDSRHPMGSDVRRTSGRCSPLSASSPPARWYRSGTGCKS
jgi:Co/Zn/Cd efflux system component